LRTLLIEDNPGDARLVKEALSGDIQVECRGSLSSGLERLAEEPMDAVLLDLSLPDSRGFETFARIHTQSPNTPIVLLTGTDDEALALRALQGGAQDYVVKESMDRKRLPRIVRYAIERKRSENLSRSNADLERFAMAASHDLQAPLRKIMAFGDALSRLHGAQLSPQGREILSRMVSSAEHMTRMISDILQVSRVVEDPVDIRPVDLSSSVSEALDDLEPLIAETGAAPVEVGLLPTIQASPTQMRRLFQNLLSNALKFRRPGTPPRISVTSRSLKAGFVSITVRDEGIGLDPLQAERIFSPFGRGGPPGSGIGLATCRAIVLRHHGRISADGALGRGAAFTVELPARR
jgi:signal transduction histidine kinase